MKTKLILILLCFFISSCISYKQFDDPIYGGSVDEDNARITSISCDEIEKSFDRFTDKTIFETPPVEIGKGSLRDVKQVWLGILKTVRGEDISLKLGFVGITANYRITSKGVIILLDNGQKIVEPEINFKLVETSSIADVYLGELHLTDEMIGLLKNNNITDIRIFAFNSISSDEFIIPENESLKLKFYLNCLLTNNQSRKTNE